MQVTYEYFGEMKTHDLVECGGDKPVTNESRERYRSVKSILKNVCACFLLWTTYSSFSDKPHSQ